MLPDSPTLAALNATLNASSALCLISGFLAIQKKQIIKHRAWMISAFILSTLFLTSYITRYAVYGDTPYQGQGLLRPIYFTLLISHILCAIIALPLVLTTFYLALRNNIRKHRRFAKLTFPLWTYVSITGVIIYLMLYQL